MKESIRHAAYNETQLNEALATIKVLGDNYESKEKEAREISRFT